MTNLDELERLARANIEDEVFQASIDFIGTLTGMEPPPIEVAPPEVFAPFHEFTKKVMSITAVDRATVLGLIERVREAEQDAARYRWIRRHERFHIAVGDDADAVFSSAADEPEDLDDAIDCALQAEQKGGES